MDFYLPSVFKVFVFCFLTGFWNDCKLPDYEEVVGHPPTPPPPYSENPAEVAPAPVPQVSLPDSVPVPPMPEETDSRQDSQASGSSPDQEAVLMPIQVLCQAPENAHAPFLAEEDEDEELVTRRRHVTGDSGIEVCVCQLDVEEGSGFEEESDDEPRMCRVTGQDCCSGHQQQTFRQKEHTPEMPSQTASTSTSTGDHMV